MNLPPRLARSGSIGVLVALLAQVVAPVPIEAQFGGLIRTGACLGAGVLGWKAGEAAAEKLAQVEAVKRNLSPADTQKMILGFKIGLALAFCGGGQAIAGTTYSKLSKRGKENREKEILAALEDASPHTYTDPENPSLVGTAVAQPPTIEGNRECRIVDDQLGADQAFVKQCRPVGGGKWTVDKI